MTVTINGTTGIDKVQDAVVQNATLASGVPSTAKLPAGTVLQVVQTVKTDTFTTTSAGPVDVTGFSASITPSSASNKILVIVNANGSTGGNNNYFQIVRDSTNVYSGTGGSTNKSAWIYPLSVFAEQYVPMTYLDSPSTTSSVTYKIQVGSDGSGTTFAINRRANDTAFGYPCSITLMEIAA